MASGPLDNQAASPSLHDAAATIPRIRNPVVESWNGEDSPARTAATGRVPGTAPYTAPPVMRSASAANEPVGPSAAERLIPALLVLALFLVASSAIVVGLTAVPLQPYLISWRYSLVGAVSMELLAPLTAVTLVTASVLIAERTRAAKVAALLWALAATAIVPVVFAFLLDALQMRPILDSALQGRVFVVAVAKTVLLLLGAMLVLLTNAYILFRASRQWSKNDLSVAEWQR